MRPIAGLLVLATLGLMACTTTPAVQPSPTRFETAVAQPLDNNSHFHRLALAPAGICRHLVLNTGVPKFKHQAYHIPDFRLFGVALFSDRAIL